MLVVSSPGTGIPCLWVPFPDGKGGSKMSYNLAKAVLCKDMQGCGGRDRAQPGAVRSILEPLPTHPTEQAGLLLANALPKKVLGKSSISACADLHSEKLLLQGAAGSCEHWHEPPQHARPAAQHSARTWQWGLGLQKGNAGCHTDTMCWIAGRLVMPSLLLSRWHFGLSGGTPPRHWHKEACVSRIHMGQSGPSLGPDCGGAWAVPFRFPGQTGGRAGPAAGTGRLRAPRLRPPSGQRPVLTLLQPLGL